MTNGNLTQAKTRKYDEFYTQYSTIMDEVELYVRNDKDLFRDKVVYCPCDNYQISNFSKYFRDNFERFGLRKLISSCYSLEAQEYYSSSLFDDNPVRFEEHGLVQVVDRSGESVYSLEGNGDFRSRECLELLEQADMILTNPPFSLFKEFFNTLNDFGKRYIILGGITTIGTYDVFKKLRNNTLWLGHSLSGTGCEFSLPGNYPFNNQGLRVDDDGNKFLGVPVGWYTNIDHHVIKPPLELLTMEENFRGKRGEKLRALNAYEKFDNYNAIEVPATDAIPSDYDGVMGVPISFMNKYCRDQFELIGISDNSYNDLTEMVFDGNGSDYPIVIKGRALYKRIFIKHRR